MMQLTQSRRKARVCGCSSMAEQKLPKLLTTAVFRHPSSKTLHETRVWNQTLGFRGKTKTAPAGRQSDKGLTATIIGGSHG